MSRRFPASFSALVLTLSLAAGTAAAERPPQNLHLVGDHWTAWEPPASLPPDAEVYIIAPGDTLWDLAARFYGDPYLWPQLWEGNRYILDAHWIYPGDPLLVGTEVTAVEDLAALDREGGPGAREGEEGAPGVPEGEVGIQPAETSRSPVPLGVESDIYCTGYVGEMEESFPFSIIGSEYEALGIQLGGRQGASSQVGRYGSVGTLRYGMATGDVVYVDGGRRAGLSAGEVMMVIQPGERVIHPQTREPYGRLYEYTGRLRILSVQEETAIAEILSACDPVVVGSRLRPFEPEPVPLARRTVMRPTNLPSPAESLAGAPVILAAHDDLVALGEDHVVYIDAGEEQEVTPGDIYTIYRLHRQGLPPVIVGELAVLSVHPRSSVAKIIASRHTIYAGDRLELK